MSFPAIAYTSSSAAVSDFINKAKANGLVTSTSVDVYALAFATLANLFENLPNTTGLSRSAVLADAGDVPANVSFVELENETGDPYAIDLVAPLASEYGQVKVIYLGDKDADGVTMSIADLLNAPNGDTLATFASEGVSLCIVGTPAGWLYLGDNAVTFSSPD
jgi:hypothetical protein